ncbi:hypothetical protein HMI56_000833 [Coelomomyces lativittatus]|nr:hypothetical protein HMI56_000833 [Coelomomyces lativittatus]
MMLSSLRRFRLFPHGWNSFYSKSFSTQPDETTKPLSSTTKLPPSSSSGSSSSFTRPPFSLTWPGQSNASTLLSSNFNHEPTRFMEPTYSILHIHASSNNTVVSMSKMNGDVLAESSGGQVGYKKGMRAGFEPAYKATHVVLTKMADQFGSEMKHQGVIIKFNGFGPGREAAWKCIQTFNWKIVMVKDVTPIPHGGCRPRKKRRL